MRHLPLALLVAIALAGCGADKRPAPALENYAAPRQGPLPRSYSPIPAKGEVTLRPRATFELEAYVMRVEVYSRDKFGGVSPSDLAVAWGPAANESVQNALEVTQADREFQWKLDDKAQLFLTPAALASNVANIHTVPANDEIAAMLKRVKAGHSVRAQGMLVDFLHPSVGERTTSVSRTDTGPGSTEIFYITELEIIGS